MAHPNYEIKVFHLNFCVIRNPSLFVSDKLQSFRCSEKWPQSDELSRVGNFPPLDFYYYITWILT